MAPAYFKALSWLLVCAGVTTSNAQPAGKRLILHDLGGPNRLAPEFVRSRLEHLETLPLDGLAILMCRNYGVDNLSAKVLQPSAVSVNAMADILSPIAAMRSDKLRWNFSLVYFGPGFSIYDDEKWAVSTQNMANLGEALSSAGMTGIFFDNENYDDYADWRPGSPTCDARLHSLEDCQAKMRERGGQIMRALQSAFPGVVVLFFHDAYTSDRTFFDLNPRLPNVDAANELVGPFVVGFAETKGPEATVIQGGENAGAHTYDDFDKLYQYSKFTIAEPKSLPADSSSRASRTDGGGFIPPSLRSRWSSLVSVGTEVRNLDNVDRDGNPVNMSATVANALARADQYAWLYMDVPPKGWLHTSLLEPPTSSADAATQEFVDAVKAGRAMTPAVEARDPEQGIDEVNVPNHKPTKRDGERGNCRVSIVIPLWNSAGVLKGCLDSCAEQTFKNFDVICVDNCSPDASAAIAESYAAALPLHIIRLDRNEGYAGGCNAGLRATDAEFVLILNSDAEIHPELLENAVDRLRAEPAAATVCGPIYDLSDAGRTKRVQSRGQYLGLYLRFLTYPARFERDGFRVLAPGSPVLFARRAALDDVRLSNGDYYDSRFGSYGEDIDLSLRFNAAGWQSVFAANCISWHMGTMSLGGAKRVWQKSATMQRIVVRNKYLVFYGTLPLPVIAFETPSFWIGDAASMFLCAIRRPSALRAFTLAKWDLLRSFGYLRWKRRETGAKRIVGWWPLYSRMLRDRVRSLF